MRLIDADGLIETLVIVAKKMAKSDAQKTLIGRVLYIIEHKPTVDAVPVVHGRWIEADDGWGDEEYQCSNCGEVWVTINGTPAENNMKYCANCGAKMDGKEGELNVDFKRE